jgi:hypothetical protein
MNTVTANATFHVFEHIAPAPYRYVGVTRNRFSPCQGVESKPGGTCDHCMTGIEWEFWFVAGDGTRFKVGSTCVEKSGDKGLRRAIAADLRKHQANLRVALDAKKQAEIAELMANPVLRSAFSSRPHPNAHYASQGRTMLDYYEFMVRCSGAAGRARIVKSLRSELAGQ